MNTQAIEEKLKKELTNIVRMYPFLTYKYEFNEKRNKFLVSVSSDRKIERDEEIWDVFLESEQGFEDEFGMSAPLFTSDERLFKLSSKAVVIKQNRSVLLLSEDFVEDTVWGEYRVENITDMEDFYGGLPEYSLAA